MLSHGIHEYMAVINLQVRGDIIKYKSGNKISNGKVTAQTHFSKSMKLLETMISSIYARFLVPRLAEMHEVTGDLSCTEHHSVG
jgi:hypothetical protein